MNKDGSITISNFQKGMSSSPYLGFAHIRNCDIRQENKLGSIRINRKSIATASTINGLIKWFVTDTITGSIYGLTSTGYLYKSVNLGQTWTEVTGNTKTLGYGQGLVYWKGNIFVARSTSLDVYEIDDSTWSNGWQTLNTVYGFHPIIVGQDDILYIGNGRYVASLQENTGQDFDKDTGATYTWNAQALDLPEDYEITTMCELGTNLLIGTRKGANLYEQKVADIFPWDRTSDTFELPIKLEENGINQMININNTVYVCAGIIGNFYTTNGSSTQLAFKVPINIEDTEYGTWINPYPNAIMLHKGALYFGLSTGGGNLDPLAIYSYKNGVLTIENTISTGADGSTGIVQIGSLLSVGNEAYIIGWQSASTYGIDTVAVDNGNRVTSYGAYFESQMFRVGSNLKERTFTTIDFSLGKPLSSGQGVRISYRKNIEDSYTVIGTFDYATLGAVISHNSPAYIADAEWVQIKCELTTTNATTPELVEIRIS